MIDFSSINIATIKQHIETELTNSQKSIELLAQSQANTFDELLIPLESATLELDRWKSILYNLHSADTSPELEAALEELSPKISAFGNWYVGYTPLFQKIETLYNSDQSTWTTEQQTLVEETYQYFVLNGTQLSQKTKDKIAEINTKLSLLSLDFAKRVLADQNEFTFHTTDVADLAGIPQSMLDQWQQAATQEDQEGYLLKLDMPTYMAILRNGDRRATRELFYKAFNSRGNQDNDNNTHSTIQEIVTLRQTKAELLGFGSYAEYTLKSRMAKTPQTVLDFLVDLEEKVKPLALKQKEELEQFAQTQQSQPLERWDLPYWSDKLKKETIELDENELKAYFSLEHCIKGIFTVANTLYGLEFKRLTDYTAYHSDVQTYEVFQNGQLLSYFMMDMHPRDSKRNGAWMTSYRDAHKLDGTRQVPIISIVCNFSKPTPNAPSLLLWDEVLTLFHEFGHALHGMLAQSTYPSVAGTNVYWDFVELPSQILENWCYEKACLDLFAQHYQTGEPLPQSTLNKLQLSAQFQEGIACMRQLGLGKLDMAWHHNYTPIDDVEAFEKSVLKSIDLFDSCEGTCTSTAFSHIFQGGYAAGYYSYKWAEVLDAHAFEIFKSNGIFDKQTAERFEQYILSKGGEQHPQALFEQFAKSKPSIDPLLKRMGL